MSPTLWYLFLNDLLIVVISSQSELDRLVKLMNLECSIFELYQYDEKRAEIMAYKTTSGFYRYQTGSARLKGWPSISASELFESMEEEC